MFKSNVALNFLVVQYLSGVPAKTAIEEAGATCTERNIQKMATSHERRAATDGRPTRCRAACPPA